MEVTFRIYDADGDGYVTREELIAGMRANIVLNGKDPDNPQINQAMQSQVQKIVELTDLNQDGKISLIDIQNSLKEHPELLHIL
jgi:Ca2+-binding EF-hand superfamily protein